MSAVAPILPSRDLGATSAFYERLGYEEVGLWQEEYLIVARGDIGLHFFHCPGEGVPRVHGAPEETAYGLREFAVVDADGNLLRIGSPLAERG